MLVDGYFTESQRKLYKQVTESQSTTLVPLKQGEWVKADSQQYFRKHYPLFTCSACGYRKDSQKKWNYCPNCGCRMKEE